MVARCLSPKSEPYDATKHEAAEAFLGVISRDLGRITSFTTWGPDGFHMPFLEVFMGFWGVHRESCVVEKEHGRAIKELVAAAVSAISNCQFCANAHGLCAQAAGMQAALKVIQQREPSLIADEGARKIVEWTLNVFLPTTDIIKNPPFTKQEAPELIGTIFATVYMNVITHNFVSDRAVPPKLPDFLRSAYEKNETFKKIVTKAAVKVLKKETAKAGRMASVVKLLPKEYDEESVELPEDLKWVNGDEDLKKGMKFWYWTICEESNALIPGSLRKLVEEYMLQEYNCEEIDISPRDWAMKIINKSKYGKFVVENDDRVWAEVLLILGADPTKLHACSVLTDFKKMYTGEVGEWKLKVGAMMAAFLRARRVCSFLGAPFN